MKTLKLPFLVFLISLTFILSSCDTQYFHNYNFSNATSNKIKLTTFIKGTSTDIVIDAGAKSTLKSYTDKSTDIEKATIVNLYDSVFVYKEDDNQLLLKWTKEADLSKDKNYKNIYFEEDWAYVIDKNSAEFTISDEDVNSYKAGS